VRQSRIFAVDFDGTLAMHEYPGIGPEVPGAIDVLRGLQSNGHKIILYTMRSGEALRQAVDWVTERGIHLYGANENPDQGSWTSSPKVYAHHYIDDAAVGCPLVYGEHNRPYVDWDKVRSLVLDEIS